jgi:hypothetical protein
MAALSRSPLSARHRRRHAIGAALAAVLLLCGVGAGAAPAVAANATYAGIVPRQAVGSPGAAAATNATLRPGAGGLRALADRWRLTPQQAAAIGAPQQAGK